MHGQGIHAIDRRFDCTLVGCVCLYNGRDLVKDKLKALRVTLNFLRFDDIACYKPVRCLILLQNSITGGSGAGDKIKNKFRTIWIVHKDVVQPASETCY